MTRESIKKTVGKRLRAIRKKNNLTQEQLSKYFPEFLAGGTISRYETADRTPDIEFMIAFGKHFGLNPEWLFYGIGPQQVSGKGEPKKPEEIYFELIESLKDKPFDLDTSQFDTKFSDTHPEFILDMLKMMSVSEETKSEILRFYILMIRKKALDQLSTV